MIYKAIWSRNWCRTNIERLKKNPKKTEPKQSTNQQKKKNQKNPKTTTQKPQNKKNNVASVSSTVMKSYHNN